LIFFFAPERQRHLAALCSLGPISSDRKEARVGEGGGVRNYVLFLPT